MEFTRLRTGEVQRGTHYLILIKILPVPPYSKLNLGNVQLSARVNYVYETRCTSLILVFSIYI